LGGGELQTEVTRINQLAADWVDWQDVGLGWYGWKWVAVGKDSDDGD